MANPSKELKVRYQQDLMIWRTPLLRAGLLTLLFLLGKGNVGREIILLRL